jgi:hypothetical protein
VPDAMGGALPVLVAERGCLREVVARRPRTAGGMGTDGTRATHEPLG